MTATSPAAKLAAMTLFVAAWCWLSPGRAAAAGVAAASAAARNAAIPLRHGRVTGEIGRATETSTVAKAVAKVLFVVAFCWWWQ